MSIKTCRKREEGGCRWRCNVGGKKKHHINENHGQEPIQQKYKANENTSRHNPKKKQEQTINKN
jgi:hypothetical protein